MIDTDHLALAAHFQAKRLTSALWLSVKPSNPDHAAAVNSHYAQFFCGLMIDDNGAGQIVVEKAIECVIRRAEVCITIMMDPNLNDEKERAPRRQELVDILKPEKFKALVLHNVNEFLETKKLLEKETFLDINQGVELVRQNAEKLETLLLRKPKEFKKPTETPGKFGKVVKF